MKIDFATPFVAALALWRRDRAILMPVAGLLIFVPQLAVLMLVPAMPRPVGGDATQEAMLAWSEAFAAWAGRHGIWYVAAPLVALLATLTIAALYVSRERPAVGAALLRALALLPRYALATILISLPVGGLVLMALPFPLMIYVLIGPVFYIFARTMLVGPVLVAEAPVGAVAAIVRSWRLTGGNGWVLTCIYAAAALAGPMAASVFMGIERIGGPNPVLIAITSIGGALATTVAALALQLAQVVIYGRLASTGT